MLLSNTNNKENIYYALTSSSRDKLYQVIQIQLTDMDNEPSHFWNTFVHALSYWDLMLTQNKKQSGFPASAKAVQAFIAEIAELIVSNPLVLEVNNCQKIRHADILAFLHALNNIAIPELFVLLLFGDTDDETLLNTIEENKFRYFSVAEEQAYYKKSGFIFEKERFMELRSFTGGWSNAVILLAAQMKDESSRREIDNNIEAYFIKWLEKESYQKYTSDERKLYVCMSLLDEFPLGLLRSLSGWNDNSIIRMLETSPFMFRNPETGRFYFAKFVRKYLLQRKDLVPKNKIRQFFIQAGDWYHKQNMRIDAINCYRKTGSNSKILHVILQWTFPMSRELAKCYYDAISAMPVSFVESHPILEVIQCYTLCTMYRYDDARKKIEHFCMQHDKGENTPAEMRSTLGEAYLVWAHTFIAGTDAENLLKRLMRAAELLPNGSTLIRAKVNRVADVCSIMLPSPKAGSMKESLAFLQKLDPYFNKALYGGGVGSANLATAEMHFYTRNLKEAERFSRKAITDGMGCKQYDMICAGYFLLMRCSMATGNYEKLMENFEFLKINAQNASYDTFFSMPDLAQSWLFLRLGRKHEIADWIIDVSRIGSNIKPWNQGRNLVLCADYLLQNGSYMEAVSLAETGVPTLLKIGQTILAIYLWLVQAIAHYHLEESDAAVRALDLAYHWCHANEVVMPVIESGAQIAPLCSAYKSIGGTNIPDAWLTEMKRKANSYQAYQNNIRRKYSQQQQMKFSVLEYLTNAEQKLLLKISEGYSVRQIAEIQGKSTNAIKIMLNNVYNKLGANNLAEAVRIATENDINRYFKS